MNIFLWVFIAYLWLSSHYLLQEYMSAWGKLAMYALLVILVHACYTTVVVSPFLPTGSKADSDIRKITVEQEIEIQENARFCHSCKLVKGLRTHHCSRCNRCSSGMDHHCWYA